MSENEAAFDAAEQLNAIEDGWNDAMGVRFVKATRDEVVAEFTVDDRHRQPYGIVHGGVYAGVIESVASAGAALVAMSRGQSAVGLENHTSFIRAVREGVLRATGTPLTRGRRTQSWEVTIADENGKVAATGRVRLLCLEDEATLAGQPAGYRPKGT